MPKIYSVDLREKVMQLYHKTNHKSNTCKIFRISGVILDDWIRMEMQTGSLKQPKLLSYTRFIEIMPQCLQALSSFFHQVKDTGNSVIDSTKLVVCQLVFFENKISP